MKLFFLAGGLLGSLCSVEAVGETYIYIDQVPLYSKLPSCAKDRLSAIIRAQSSGCGDGRKLTSFSCFCMDSSTSFVDIISTAVADKCQSASGITRTALSARHAAATPALQTPTYRARIRAPASSTPTATSATPGNVRSALEVFDSYCSRSTELTRYDKPSTVIITQTPPTVFVTSAISATGSENAGQAQSGSSKKKGTPIAAIVAPSVIVPIALATALLFFLHRRRQNATKSAELQTTQYPVIPEKLGGPAHELYAQHQVEMPPGQHMYELPPDHQPPVELSAGQPAHRKA